MGLNSNINSSNININSNINNPNINNNSNGNNKKKNNNNLKFEQLGKVIGKGWRELSRKKRNKLEEKAEIDRERYR